MNFNLDDLVKFYASDLGKTCVKIIQNKLNKIVIKQNNQKILGFGYLLPYILNNDLESKVNFLAIPSANNQIKWNKNNYNSSLELDEKALPFQDLHFDKILISHWFEVSSRLDLVIDELWRILKGQGKLILIIPNAFSLWAINENNPFGKCRPFSKYQIIRLLNSHGFEEIKVHYCLYHPPYHNKFILRNFQTIEFLGNKVFYKIGGVMIIEATKFNYAIPKTKLKAYRYNLPKVSIQQQG